MISESPATPPRRSELDAHRHTARNCTPPRLQPAGSAAARRCMSAVQTRPGTLQGRASLPLPPRFPAAAGETSAAPPGLLSRQLSTASADSSAFATARSAPLSIGAAAAAATGSAGAPAFTYSAAERLPAMAGEDDQLEFDEDALFTEDHDEVRLCRVIYPCNDVRRVRDALANEMGTDA